jgi:hypothetical protein
MGQQYCHSSLKSPRSIRVLHLNSSDSATQPLGCSLEEISLDNVPEYDALSYSWDAQTASEAVDCDGKILNITPNCVAALRQLRRKKAKRTMWIDSICIDQTSVNERNQQVELMGEVYQRAKNVIVWLGEVDAKSRAALKWLGEIGNLAQWGVGTVGSGELFKKANQKVEQMMKGKVAYTLLSMVMMVRKLSDCCPEIKEVLMTPSHQSLNVPGSAACGLSKNPLCPELKMSWCTVEMHGSHGTA